MFVSSEIKNSNLDWDSTSISLLSSHDQPILQMSQLSRFTPLKDSYGLVSIDGKHAYYKKSISGRLKESIYEIMSIVSKVVFLRCSYADLKHSCSYLRELFWSKYDICLFINSETEMCFPTYLNPEILTKLVQKENEYVISINKFLDSIIFDNDDEKNKIATALNIHIHQSKVAVDTISVSISNKIKPITDLLNEIMIASKKMPKLKEMVFARIAAKIDALNLNERKFARAYRELTRDFLDRIPIKTIEEGLEIANALDVLINPQKQNATAITLDITNKIKPVADLLNEPEDWAEPENIDFFKKIVTARIDEKIHSLKTDAEETRKLISRQKENKILAEKYIEKVANAKPPVAGSEASTVPRNQEEWMMSTLACIQEIRSSPLGQQIDVNLLYGLANNEFYSQGVWEAMTRIRDNAENIAEIIKHFHPPIQWLQDLSQLPGSHLDQLNKWIKEKNVPLEGFSSEQKNWIGSHPEQALKLLQHRLSLSLLAMTSPDKISLTIHLLESDQISFSLTDHEIIEKVNEFVSSFNIEDINQKKLCLTNLFDIETLSHLLLEKGDQLKYLHLENVKSDIVLKLIKYCPNINHLYLHKCDLRNKGKDLASSEQLKNLTELYLTYTDIGDEGMIALASSENLKNLTGLDLTGNGIRKKGIKALAHSEQLKNLTKLNLSSNFIKAKGVKELANSEHLINLTELDLCCNILNVEGAKELANAKQLKKLTSLELRWNHVGDEGVKELANSELLKNLSYLGLCNNEIGDEGTKALASSELLKNLKRLDLGWNNIQTQGAKALANAKFINLTALQLVYNQISDDGAVALASSEQLINLTVLGISENKICAKGMKALARSELLKKLQVLVLSHNPFGDEGAEELASSEKLNNLEVLYLIGNKIGDKGTKALASSEQLMNLTGLYLSNNPINYEGIKALANSDKLKNLTYLHLRTNKINDEGVKELAHSELSKKLTVLDLSENLISDQGANELAASENLINLTVLYLRNNQFGDEGANALRSSKNFKNTKVALGI